MEKIKIFFTAEYDANELEPLAEFAEILFDGWARGLPKLTEAQLAEKAADADMIVTSYDDITREVIEHAPHLKLIACTRATPVNIDVQAAREKNIPVLFTPGRNSDSAAELTVALMLCAARHVPQAHSALKKGLFTAPETVPNQAKAGLKQDVIWDMTVDAPYTVFKGTQLKGKTLGILGYGSIGRRVGKIARAMGMQLLVYDPYQSEIEIEEIGIMKVRSLEQLMRESDFITCHMKVTPETRGMINRERIALMKPSAYFINTSRGSVLDESAMIDALRRKKIAGAAFDVYEHEPLARNHPYITELDNVVVTPHIAGATREVLTNHTRQIVSDIIRFMRKEPLLYRYK
ncbi:2-hydroxyacid dehydrogenase [Treponema brennaborense]|uniref:Phosphoglycerate dehydrogenase n=1 Tax=Treponema brennaborense (strain DSM 12168 / CIP 105900 / DD5/3) TaxID=906968 RepID=F4LKQ0_TREBD|nr:2-hydroxyacid dehydrogenase [Treponema brennaborense]AEE15511.1 Phosphoglycerate dehydrogenase [Treponema brennaborense DSM 12168]